MKIALAALVALSACTPAIAGESQAGYSHQRTCFKSEYREEYIPGTEDDPGYVKSWKGSLVGNAWWHHWWCYARMCR